MTLWPDRGDGRKVHYGPGKQPIDTWMELGWAPVTYGAMVIRYLRRDKEPEHSLESARFYFKGLNEFAEQEAKAPHGTKRVVLGANSVLGDLLKELTAEERARLLG